MSDRNSGRGKSAYVQLQRIAKRDKENFQHVLVRYGIERFLARLANSPHAKTLILKGGTLFGLWMRRWPGFDQ